MPCLSGAAATGPSLPSPDARMDGLRYALALTLVCGFPPLLLWWPVVHGGIAFWRRRGPAVTYTVLLGLCALVAAGMAAAREPLLAVEFGTRGPVVALAVAFLFAAGWLRWKLHRDITNELLAGLPELAPETHPQALVTTGLYARVRHPRYAQICVLLLGWALLCNYLATYIVWLLWLPAMHAIVRFEERELSDRFGEQHVEYCRRVPRFIPRFGAERA